jgi:hypothetical protein
VVLVDEMRDLETIAAALTIAETGHLTFATLWHGTRRSPSGAAQESEPRKSISLVVESCQALVTTNLIVDSPDDVPDRPGAFTAAEDRRVTPPRDR